MVFIIFYSKCEQKENVNFVFLSLLFLFYTYFVLYLNEFQVVIKLLGGTSLTKERYILDVNHIRGFIPRSIGTIVLVIKFMIVCKFPGGINSLFLHRLNAIHFVGSITLPHIT